MSDTLELGLAPRGENQLCGVARRRVPGRSLRRLLCLVGLALGSWILGALLHGSSASAATPDPQSRIPVATSASQHATTIPHTIVRTARSELQVVAQTAKTLSAKAIRTVTTTVPGGETALRKTQVAKLVVINMVRAVPSKIVRSGSQPTLATHRAAASRDQVTTAGDRAATQRITLVHKEVRTASGTLWIAGQPGSVQSLTTPPTPAPAPSGWWSPSDVATTCHSGESTAFTLTPNRPSAEQLSKSRRVGHESDALPTSTSRRPSFSPD